MYMKNSSGIIQKKIITLGLPEKESLEDAERVMMEFLSN
jgi:hypothetical protein